MAEQGASADNSASRTAADRAPALARRMWRALVFVPFVGGCTFNEAVPELGIPLPASYRSAPAKPAPAPRADWPALFGSRELTMLAQEAEAQNLDIAAAVARIKEADAQAEIDAAGLYPVLTGTAAAQHAHSSGAARSKTPPFVSTNSNLFSFGVNASYEVDFWGRNLALANVGDLLAKASRFDREVVALSTIAAVVTDYLLILSAQDRIRIAKENIAVAERLLDAIKGRLSVGTATALDVAQQEAVVDQQRALVPPLEQQLQQNRNLLSVLLGRTPESVNVRGGSLNALAIPRIAPGLPSALLRRRPDVAEAEARLAAQNENVIAARGAMFPSIALTGQGGFESLLLKNLLRPEAGFFTLASGITAPILDGGTLAGQLGVQKGTRTELLEDYRKAVLTAFSDVENALIAVREAAEHERLQAAAVEASRRAQVITEARLKEGTIDVTTLLQVETTLFSAEDELSQIRLQRLQAIVSLFQALGGGFTGEIEPPLPPTSTIKPFIPVPLQAVSDP